MPSANKAAYNADKLYETYEPIKKRAVQQLTAAIGDINQLIAARDGASPPLTNDIQEYLDEVAAVFTDAETTFESGFDITITIS